MNVFGIVFIVGLLLTAAAVSTAAVYARKPDVAARLGQATLVLPAAATVALLVGTLGLFAAEVSVPMVVAVVVVGAGVAVALEWLRRRAVRPSSAATRFVDQIATDDRAEREHI